MSFFKHSLGYFAVVFLALAPIIFTSAGVMSSGPQKVADYYVYRSLIAAFGTQQKKMLPKLAGKPGSHKDGGMNFLEFENAISVDKLVLNPADYAAAGVIDLDDPDLKAVSNFLLSKGKVGDTKNSMYFPPNPNKKFPDIIALLNVAFSEAYDELDKKGKADDLNIHVDKLKEALKNVVEVRTSEMVSNTAGNTGVVDELRKRIPGTTIVLDSQPWALNSKKVLYSINMADTIQKSSGVKGYTVAGMNNIIQNYGKSNTGSVADAHFNILEQYSAWKDDMEPCE